MRLDEIPKRESRNKEEDEDDMILYVEHPEDTTRKLLELINEFGKVTRYKSNIQKSVAFLHTNSEVSEREVKETISFTIATKRIQYLGINLSLIHISEPTRPY